MIIYKVSITFDKRQERYLNHLGFSIIFVVDLQQLPPVGDRPIYEEGDKYYTMFATDVYFTLILWYVAKIIPTL